jgi:hypothetical protein
VSGGRLIAWAEVDPASAPCIGVVYESARSRVPYALGKKWRWEVIADHAGDLWELARIGGNRTRRGNLLRTAAELSDPKKWRLLGRRPSPDPSAQAELLPLPEGLANAQ